jgi:hypothetical protein
MSSPFLTTAERENPISIIKMTTMKGIMAMILAIIN